MIVIKVPSEGSAGLSVTVYKSIIGRVQQDPLQFNLSYDTIVSSLISMYKLGNEFENENGIEDKSLVGNLYLLHCTMETVSRAEVAQ